jgi:hypothetical protein
VSAQISLLSGLPEDVERQVSHVERGRLTDDRMRAAIIQLRAAGVPVRRVCEVLGTSAHTVIAAERSDPDLLATLKERQAQSWDTFSIIAVESLIEKALRGELKPGEMGLNAAIAVDKSAVLRGEATVRIEVGERLPTAAEIMERMRRASIPVAAVVVSSDSQSDDKQGERQ